MINKLLWLSLFFVSSIFAQITFDANFESGNLLSVEEVDSVSFNIYSVADNNATNGYLRWYYYRISGVQDKKINVRLLNGASYRPMYSYDNINFNRFSKEESPVSSYFEKRFEQDTVYVAFYTPYNYSFLQERINTWKQSEDVKVDTLGFTQKLLPIQEIIITDFSVPDTEKLPIWIHARTHPSETPSSWHFDGIVERLLSSKEEIAFYKQKLVFHLIPFTNPDGVYYGKSRVNFDGVDLERDWFNFNTTEVNILKSRMEEILSNKVFPVFLNLHSQSSHYCTFWIHYANGTSESFFDKEMQFSHLNVSDNPYFTPNDFSFSTLKNYFPEGWLWENHGEEVMALTYETPYSYYHNNADSTWVDNDNLRAIGSRTVYSIAEYLELSHPHHSILDNSTAEVVGDHNVYPVGNGFYGYGEDFTALPQGASDSYVQFTSETLPSGNYDLSAWWAKSPSNSYATHFIIDNGSTIDTVVKTQTTNESQWNFLTTIELRHEGEITIRIEGNNTGLVVADALRLIYAGNITDVEDEKLPNDFTLYQNYPNPFNPSTTIRYSISASQSRFTNNQVSLKVYDILGKEVVTLVDEYQSSGEYEAVFDISSLSKQLTSGPYFYRLQVGDYLETKKMLLLK